MTYYFSRVRDSVRYLIFEPANSVYVEVFRYLFVGGISFVVDAGLLFILVHFFYWHYLVAAAMAFIFGLICNYTLSKYWVFSRAAYKNKFIEFVIFSAIGIGGLLLNELFLWVFTTWIGLYYMVSKVISAGIIYAYNFIVRKMVLFR